MLFISSIGFSKPRIKIKSLVIVELYLTDGTTDLYWFPIPFGRIHLSQFDNVDWIVIKDQRYFHFYTCAMETITPSKQYWECSSRKKMKKKICNEHWELENLSKYNFQTLKIIAYKKTPILFCALSYWITMAPPTNWGEKKKKKGDKKKKKKIFFCQAMLKVTATIEGIKAMNWDVVQGWIAAFHF